MHAKTMNLFGISFILVSCLSSLCVQPALANWPVFYIEKGGTAVVPCVPKGDETAYFWSKGEDFATSQSVASRVLGIPSSDSEKYLVNEDGSLVINNVTLAEGGRYHCRIVSENTNCRGAVSIEVTVNDFTFGIEQCEPSESCTLQVEASKETKLTCTAKGGPLSLSLKWFNGSKEINSVSSEPPMNEESSTISETITVPNEFGLPFTCEAVASEDEQACARLAHVRLDKTDTAKEQTDADKSSATWIVLLVLLIVVSGFTVFLLIVYVLARRQINALQKEKSSEQERLIAKENKILQEKEDELKTAAGKLTEEQTAHKETKEALTTAAGKLKVEQAAHKKTKEELNTAAGKLNVEKAAHEETKEELNTAAGILNVEKAAHEETKEEQNTAAGKLNVEKAAHEKTKEELNTAAGKLNVEKAAHKKTKEELNTAAGKLNVEQAAHEKTKEELNTAAGKFNVEKAAHEKTKEELNTAAGKFNVEKAAHEKTKEELNTAAAGKLTDEQAAHKKTKEELNTAVAGKLNVEQAAHEKTKEELNTAAGKLNVEQAAHEAVTE